jgi:hypothetical protein
MKNGGIAPEFLTSALDEVSGQLHAPAPVPIGYEAGWTPRAVWILWSRQKTLLPLMGVRNLVLYRLSRGKTILLLKSKEHKNLSFFLFLRKRESSKLPRDTKYVYVLEKFTY